MTISACLYWLTRDAPDRQLLILPRLPLLPFWQPRGMGRLKTIELDSVANCCPYYPLSAPWDGHCPALPSAVLVNGAILLKIKRTPMFIGGLSEK
jgi:hypothetical protein